MRKIIHAVLWCLTLASSGAMAAITTMTFTGTFGAGSSDQGQPNGVLGASSSLAGKPFTLVLTIEDTGSYTLPQYPDSVRNVANAKGVLTVNSASVNLGTFLATAFSTSAACGYNVTFASQDDSMNTDHISISIDSYYAPPSTTPWNAPCDVSIPTMHNVASWVSLQRSLPSSLGMARLFGEMLISHITVSSGTATPPPTATAITPQAGMWWNPAESGSGYVIEQARDVLVVTIYSYKPNGDSEWYLASGTITNNVFVGTLDKYRNGQCISCAYKDTSMIGNDGTVTIELTSPTTGFMTLPNRGRFPISKFTF